MPSKKHFDRLLSPISEFHDDPWSLANQSGVISKENWMLSYIDMLTLLLTLLVLLLAYQKLQFDESHKIANPIIVETQLETEETFIRQPQDPDRKEKSHVALPEYTETQVAEDLFQSILELYQPSALDLSLEQTPISVPIDGPKLVEPQPQTNSPAQMPNQVTPFKQPQKPIDLAELKSTAKSDQLEVIELDRSLRIEFNEEILFSSGAANLKHDGAKVLEKWIELLQQQSATIHVEGHTDDQPIATSLYPSNWELSAARAAAVTRYLIRQGIAPEQLRSIGYADTRPRGDNTSPEGRKRNRRVSIVIQTSNL